MEQKTPHQTAEELVAKGLVKWGPSRPGHGLEIVGSSVPEAEPQYSKEELEFLDWLERHRGEKLTPQERHYAVRQAKDIGDL